MQDNPFNHKNYSVTYFQTLEEAPWLLRLKKSKKTTKNFKKKLEKKQVLSKKLLKFVTLKSWKTIPWPIKHCQQLTINPLSMYSGPWVWKDLKKGENCQKIWKIARFVEKLLKFVMLKCWNHSITTRNNAVTYYQFLEEVLWHLGLIKIKKCQKFSKSLKKIAKKYKFAFLASGCSSVASHGGGGGCTWGRLGATLGWGDNSVVGGGWGNSEGGQQWGCLQPLRTALHTISISYKSPKQFELKGSKST